MIDEQWIFNKEFDKAGLSIEDAAFINVIKGLSEPSGFYEKKLLLERMYPDSVAMIARLEKLIREYDFKNTVRILPNGTWWFPCRCSEKLGTSFNPEKRLHNDVFFKLLEAGIHPSEVTYFNWKGLEKVPMEQFQNMNYNELLKLIREKTSFRNTMR